MRFPPPGHFRAAADLRARLRELGADFDLTEAVAAGSPLARPAQLLGRAAANRFSTLPMEGWDGTVDGAPGPHTLRRWRNFGRSTAALIWGGEAFAVAADGRANKNQLALGQESERHLVALLAELRAGRKEAGADPDGAIVGLQLTHSGRFARPDGTLRPRCAQRHPLLAQKYGLPADHPLLTDGELDAIGDAFVRAAAVAQRAGFHFVDVKCCHGYLLHELLAAHTRPGPYGGGLAARMRLFERIVAGIAAQCPGLHLGVRLSAGDTAPFVADPATRIGVPMHAPGVELARHHFGLARADSLQFDLREPLQFLQRCRQLGLALVNVTLGSPYWNPHLQRPAAYPPSDGYLPPQDPLLMVAAHLRTVRELKRALPDLTFVGTGYTYLQEWLPHVAAWSVARGDVDFIGLGRLLLAYPELPADLLAGRALQHKRFCRTFSDCTTAPRNGMVSGCFPLDPYYRALPEAAAVQALGRPQRQ